MDETRAWWTAAFGLLCLATSLALFWRLLFPRRRFVLDSGEEIAENRRRELNDVDEIAGLGRVLGLLGDPFLVTQMIEARRRRGGTGRTTLMLLMAILSIRAGTDVVLVGLSAPGADRLGGMLVRWLQSLGATVQIRRGGSGFSGTVWMAPFCPGVRFACVAAERLAIASMGRQYFDLYIDHAVWEFSPLTISVGLFPDRVICHASEYALGCARRVEKDPVKKAEHDPFKGDPLANLEGWPEGQWRMYL